MGIRTVNEDEVHKGKKYNSLNVSLIFSWITKEQEVENKCSTYWGLKAQPISSKGNAKNPVLARVLQKSRTNRMQMYIFVIIHMVLYLYL